MFFSGIRTNFFPFLYSWGFLNLGMLSPKHDFITLTSVGSRTRKKLAFVCEIEKKESESKRRGMHIYVFHFDSFFTKILRSSFSGEMKVKVLLLLCFALDSFPSTSRPRPTPTSTRAWRRCWPLPPKHTALNNLSPFSPFISHRRCLDCFKSTKSRMDQSDLSFHASDEWLTAPSVAVLSELKYTLHYLCT